MTDFDFTKATVKKTIGRMVLTFGLLGAIAGVQTAQAQSLDQCITSDDAPAIIATRPQMKFYPGHYLHIGQRKEAGYFLGVINEIKAADSGITGLMRRYTWSDIEPSEGNYSGLAQMEADLKDAEASGKKLFALIQVKYTSLYNGVSVPKYMRDKSPSYYFNIKGNLGTVPNWGESYVRQRFLRLLKEIAVRYDSRPGLAGVAFNETATSVDFATTTIRTNYFLGMIKMDKGAACLFRKTPVLQLTNHPKERLADYDRAFRSNAIAMGAPDVFSKTEGDQFYTAGFSYDFLAKLDNVVPRGALVAESNYY
jgi:hypothetical protein